MGDSLLAHRYYLERKLAEGGMGVTYVALDVRMPTHRRVVVKAIKFPASVTDEDRQLYQQLFHREAQALQDLGDDARGRIPRIHDYFTDGNTTYFVQDFVEGRSLLEVIGERKRIELAEAIGILNYLLETLIFVHGRRILHRDIKPPNVMIRAIDGAPVLIDFGIAKEFSEGQLGTRLGTPGYAPAEQLAFGAASFSSDLYSLGVTAIHMLTGRDPRAMYSSATGRLDWHRYSGAITTPFVAILDRATNPSPGRRYTTAVEMREALSITVSEICCPYRTYMIR